MIENFRIVPNLYKTWRYSCPWLRSCSRPSSSLLPSPLPFIANSFSWLWICHFNRDDKWHACKVGKLKKPKQNHSRKIFPILWKLKKRLVQRYFPGYLPFDVMWTQFYPANMKFLIILNLFCPIYVLHFKTRRKVHNHISTSAFRQPPLWTFHRNSLLFWRKIILDSYPFRMNSYTRKG